MAATKTNDTGLCGAQVSATPVSDRRRTKKPTRGPGLTLALVGGAMCWALLFIARLYEQSATLQAVLWPCPLHTLTGIPCFTCGITRIFLHLSHGRVFEAATLAPLPFLVVTGFLASFLWDLLARRGMLPFPHQVVPRLLTGTPARKRLTTAVFLGLWAVAIVRSILTGSP